MNKKYCINMWFTLAYNPNINFYWFYISRNKPVCWALTKDYFDKYGTEIASNERTLY